MSARAAIVAIGLWCLACDPEPEVDAGVDGGASVALSVRLLAPERVFVDEQLCLTAELEGGPAQLRWNLGDGTIAEGLEVCHTYEVVGARTIGVTATRGARTADAVVSLTVVFRPDDPLPTASSPIAYDPARDRVWVVNPDAGSVAVIDADALTLEAELTGLCDRPRTLAVGVDVVAVACQADGALQRIDADTLTPLGATDLGPGSEPYGVTADPRGGGFFVAARAGFVASLAEDGVERARVAVGPEPRGLAMRGDGLLLATRWRSRAEGATVYTLDASDPDAPTLVGETLLGPEGEDSDTDNRGVLSFLNQVVLTPDGDRAFLPALKANVVTGDHLTGDPLTSQTTARAAFAEILARDAGPAQDSLRHSFDDLDYASAVVFTPFGERAWMAIQGAQSVVLIDSYDFFTVSSIGDVGEAPQGLALSPDGDRLFVHAFLSRAVQVYDVSAPSAVELLASVGTVGEEPLAPEVLEGKRVFYRSVDPRMSRTGYLSCASCHLDGEGDGLVWDFTQRGEGLRNTIELSGRAGRAPLHWSANFDEVQDFEHDIRGGQGGAGFLDDAVFTAGGGPLGDPRAGLSAELDALAAYVQSLDAHGASPARARPGFEAARARGRMVFEAAGCSSCHSGPDYTDSAFSGGAPILHDVGTLGPGSGSRLGGALVGLDTPTLRGLHRTAPYLHDGSAGTLEDVLTTRNPTDQHGVTSGLEAAQIDDLVTFLLSLDDAAP